jgi:hypothetical protein
MMSAADGLCNDEGCGRPKHVTKSGKVEALCTMHYRLYNSQRRFAKCRTPQEVAAKREAARTRSAESYKKRKAAGTFKKWVEPKVEIPCDRCRRPMPNARYDCCAQCRRDDDIARAQHKIDARLAREALRREMAEAKAKPKVKAIDYSTNANIDLYVACKECVKYVLRSEAVSKHYCSKECETVNCKRRRRMQYQGGEARE